MQGITKIYEILPHENLEPYGNMNKTDLRMHNPISCSHIILLLSKVASYFEHKNPREHNCVKTWR